MYCSTFPRAYSQLDMAALEEVNSVLLVTQLDLPCLRKRRALDGVVRRGRRAQREDQDRC